MKLYDFALAPNPRRVRIFIAEKGIKVPVEQVDLFAAQNRTPEFLKKNPSGGLPVLELDDGSCLAESVAICRYLESLHPEPNLFGKNAREQTEIEMWNRRMELELLGLAARAFQNTSELFKGRITQFPDYGLNQRQQFEQRLVRMDAELAGREFIAGNRYTIADITALVAYEFGTQMGGGATPPNAPNLKRWHSAVSSRPSAKA